MNQLNTVVANKDHFGNDLEQYNARRYALAIDELYQGVIERLEAGVIELQDVSEIVSDLKTSAGYIEKRVAEKLKTRFVQEIEDKDLCPVCFQNEWEYEWARENYGECHGVPAYRDEVAAKMCVNCGHREEY